MTDKPDRAAAGGTFVFERASAFKMWHMPIMGPFPIAFAVWLLLQAKTYVRHV